VTDEWAIQQLMTTYAQGSSFGDLDLVLSTFLPDAVWELAGSTHKYTGVAEIRKGFQTVLAPLESIVQLNAPPVVTIEGDHATARVFIRETAKLKNGEFMEVVGYYNDRLTRTPLGWRFAHRAFKSLTSYRTAGLPTQLASSQKQ
jgi:ketosteroid isomerase-like protein